MMFVEVDGHDDKYELINVDDITKITGYRYYYGTPYVQLYTRDGSSYIDYSHNYNWWKDISRKQGRA